MPCFKQFNQNVETRKRTWFIWDGKSAKSQMVSRLTEEQKKYPMMSMLGWDALVHCLETDWRPEHEFK